MVDTEFSLLRPLSPFVKLIFFASLSIVLLATAGRERMTGQGWLLTLVYPAQNIAHMPEMVWEHLGQALRGRSDLLAQNRQLEKTVQQLRAQTLHTQAVAAENRRLRALLGALPRDAVRVQMAQVIGMHLDAVSQVLTLDRGGRDRVTNGQAVIAAAGVVGQVFRVGALSSQVMLLTDPGHSIPAQVQRTRQQVLVNGNGDPLALEIPFLAHNVDIRKGDLLLSSGLGGRFPKDVPIGRVELVDRQSGRDFSRIRVQPWVRVDRLEEVLLVWPQAATTAPTRSAMPTAKTAS